MKKQTEHNIRLKGKIGKKILDAVIDLQKSFRLRTQQDVIMMFLTKVGYKGFDFQTAYDRINLNKEKKNET